MPNSAPIATIPFSINGSANLEAYVKYFLPLFSFTNLEKIMGAYPPSLAQNLTNYDQEGRNIYQELAKNIVGESISYCPSVWMAQTMEKSGRYQFSHLHSTLEIWQRISRLVFRSRTRGHA